MSFKSGIVIKKTPYKDKSYVLTILTEEGLDSGYYHERNGTIYKELLLKIAYNKQKTEIIPEDILKVYYNLTESLVTIATSLLITSVISKTDDLLKQHSRLYYEFTTYLLDNLDNNNYRELLFLFLTKVLFLFGYSYQNFKDHNEFYNLIKTYYKLDYKQNQLIKIKPNELLMLLTFYLENGIINKKQIKALFKEGELNV